MSARGKRIFCAAGAALLAVLAIVLLTTLHHRPFVGGEKFMGEARALSASQWQAMEKGRQVRELTEDQVLFYGEKAPLDVSTQTLYLSQSPTETRWQGDLTAASPDAVVCVRQEELLSHPQRAMARGHAFPVAVVEGKTVYEGKLIFTSLPVISLDMKEGESIRGKEKHSGRIQVFDERRHAVTLSKCQFHVRGNVSSLLPKKCYRVSLTTAKGGKCKVSLCGMRTDDDWILNAMFQDPLRVREDLGYRLWARIQALRENPVKSSSMAFVELIFDGEYAGIYGLQERIDAKQLDMKSGDLLYKINDWNYSTQVQFAQARETSAHMVANDFTSSAIELKFPKALSRGIDWTPMEVYQQFVASGGGTDTLGENDLVLDTDSVLDYTLFCALLHSMDTTWKNTYLAAYAQEDGSTLLRRVVWDLNYTFGECYLYDPAIYYRHFLADSSHSMVLRDDLPYDYPALVQVRPQAAEELRALYRTWRREGVTPQYLIGMAREDMEELTGSGAMAREQARWPDSQADSDLSGLEQWITERFAFLDSYYGYSE